MRPLPVLCLLVLGAARLLSQTAPGPQVTTGPTARADPWDRLPRASLDFTHPIPLAGLPQSPFMVDPLQCSPSGTAFLQIPLPPTFTTWAFAAITKKGKITRYDAGDSQILGIDQLRTITWFPAEKYVYALVEGRKHAPGQTPGQDAKPPWQEFIAKYADDGTLDSVVPLRISFLPARFAALSSGRFVVIGEDVANHAPVMVMLDSDGDNPHPVDLFGSGSYGTESLGRFYPHAGSDDAVGSFMGRVVGSAQFVGHGDDVLLVQTGTNFPVVVMGDGGILPTVPLSLPAGIVIESLLPSSGEALYIRVVDSRTNPATHKLIAFDAVTGEALRQISVAGLLSPESVACESEGTFLGLRKIFQQGDQQGTWNLMTASEN